MTGAPMTTMGPAASCMTTRYQPHVVTQAMVDAARRPATRSTATTMARTSWAWASITTIKDGKRVSTAVAFLRPALERPNLSLITNARSSAVVRGQALRRRGS